MNKKATHANNENHLFLGIEKLEFEISDTGFNSVCLQIKGWNYSNKKKKKPDVVITFDSAEGNTIEIRDKTRPVRDYKYGYDTIVSLITAIKRGKT